MSQIVTLNDILITLLVLVGIWYSYETRKLAKLNDTNSKIRFIEKKLEKLYTPLMMNREFWDDRMTLEEFRKVISDHPDYPPDSNVQRFLSNMRKYAYLASGRLYEHIEELEQSTRDVPLRVSTPEGFTTLKSMFWNQLVYDFEKYIKELEELSSIKSEEGDFVEVIFATGHYKRFR